MINLYDYQIEAVEKMHNGCILCGGVGSGKSRTSLAYYFTQNGGEIRKSKSQMTKPKDLYIITTAHKRDTKEWEGELTYFLLATDPGINIYTNKVVIDSWNNVKKYKDVTNAFFIFDEQRVVGKGTWVKAFLKIAQANEWILLSATPGDTWSDYIPVFIANGFYRNRTEFLDRHAVWARNSKYPKISKYLEEGHLIKLRNHILVNMSFERPTTSHNEDCFCDHPVWLIKHIRKNRRNPYECLPGDPSIQKPIENASEFCYVLRRAVNSDISRIEKLKELVEQHPKVIIFYNFNYELDLIRKALSDKNLAEWNGHKHEPIPATDEWVYLVQYTAGAEGWNCTETDTIIFYSQNYSYRILKQASGRIDRLNTPFKDLYFYHLKSRSDIDLAISAALKSKKDFNASAFANCYDNLAIRGIKC